MAKKLASLTYQCGFVQSPEPGVSITVSPQNVLFNTSDRNVTREVKVDVYKGSRKLGYGDYVCSTLASGSSLGSGLTWSSKSGDDGGFIYTLTYVGVVEISKVVAFQVSVDGVSYLMAIAVQTVRDGQPGENGASGENGVWVPPIMLWSDYPAGYEFQAGKPENGDVRLDMVGILDGGNNIIPYYCAVTHTKNSRYKPGDSTRWVAADAGVYKFLATELLAAKNARIDFLSGQAIRVGEGSDMCGYFGAPTATGAILYTGADSEAEATFIVFDSGLTRWGDATGKRIELDPNSKRMLFYDDSGSLSAIHSGDTLDYTKVGQDTGSNATDSLTGSAMYKSVTGDGTQYTNLVSGKTAGGDGTLKVSVPAFTLQTNGTGFPATDKMLSQYTSQLALEILVNGSVTSTYRLGETVGFTESRTTTAKTVSVSVAKGSIYTVRLRYIGNLNASGTSTFSTTGTATVTLEVQIKVCHYGSNGYYISTSNQNYTYSIFGTDGKLHAKTVVGGTVMFDTDTEGKHF